MGVNGIRAEKGRRREEGQMTIELAVALPVLIVVALVAVNAMTFFSQCAVFDRAAHEAVRIYAAAPAYGQGIEQSCALAQQAILTALDADNVEVTVVHGVTGPDFNQFTATLEFSPTLFGRGLRASAFGVSMPRLSHSTSYVVDVYRPGVMI